MPFQPRPLQPLTINHITFKLMPHPAAPQMPYGQEGRQATVYQLGRGPQTGRGMELRGLKVFKPAYRQPAMLDIANRLEAYAGLSGLMVCRRIVIHPTQHALLLETHPDLSYAVLMPWISGPNWMEVVLERRELSPDRALYLAHNLAGVLSAMEKAGLAHCDLSGTNVLLPSLEPNTGGSARLFPVELVDVEQLYGPNLQRPTALPGGSPGYAHRTVEKGEWSALADRFAGAVLLAEMLGWCDSPVREGSGEESFFDPEELQQLNNRYRLLVRCLHARWGVTVARLFEQAWHSKTLADCPTFSQWRAALPLPLSPGKPDPLPKGQVVPPRRRSALAPAFEDAPKK